MLLEKENAKETGRGKETYEEGLLFENETDVKKRETDD